MSEVWNCEERLHHNIYHLVISSKYLENFLQTFFLQTNSSFFLHTKAWRPVCGLYNLLALFGTVNRKIIYMTRFMQNFFLNAHILLLLTQSTWPSMGVVIDPVGQRLKIAAQVYLVNLLKFRDLNFQCIARNKKRKKPRWYYKFLYLTTLWLWLKCEQHLNRIWGVFCYLFWFGE